MISMATIKQPTSRHVAWSILKDAEAGHITAVSDAVDKHQSLSFRDRAFVRELCLGVMRYGRLYDAIAKPYLQAGRVSPDLARGLRLGAHQLFALDRVPVHAAIGETVQVVKRASGQRFTGVVNAVLRKMATLRLHERNAIGPLGRLDQSAHPEQVAVRYSLPDQLYADLARVNPHKKDPASWLYINELPHLCTRSRPGYTLNAADYDTNAIIRQDGPWTWWADHQAALHGPVTSGSAVVQDYSQGKVAALVHVQRGQRVLDLCAAPGGKSLALSDSGAAVIAADNQVQRLQKMTRAGWTHIPRVVQDGCKPALDAVFDHVVVDVPCSNSGVLARRPEARWRYRKKELRHLHRLQRDLLTSAAQLVRPGGRLIYSTCSLSWHENQDQVAALDGWTCEEDHVVWPNEWQAGGYAARLRRLEQS